MSDDEFSFQIKADPSQALQAQQAVTVGLDGITSKAGKTGAALQEAFQDKQGRWRDAEGRFLAVGTQIQMVGDKAVIMGNKAADAGKKVAGAADAAHSSVTGLVAAAAAYIGAHELEGLADGYTEIGNRLRVVSKDSENFNGLMEATLGIAQDTRSSWEDVTNTYQRLSNVTHGLGLSQKQVLDLTEEMAKGAKVSGATNQEAAAAMSELTHAFSTGALQGREYRVLMRDVPNLMNELKEASGKTGAEFAEMGKHGQITGKLLIDWFGKANDSINEKFAKTVPTIAEEFVKLHNAAEQFFGETATGTGVLAGLREVIDFIVAHFETFGKILLGVGEAIIGLYVISKVISLVQMLNAAIAANPFLALITIVTIVVSLLRQFGDQINIDAGGVAKMSDVLAVLWDYIKAGAEAIKDFLENAWGKFHDAISSGIDSTGIDVSLKNIMLLIASFVDAAIAAFKILGHAIAGGLATAFLGIAEGFQSLINSIVDGINAVINVGKNAGNWLATQKNYATELARWHDSNGSRDPTADEKANLMKNAQYDSEIAGGGVMTPSISHVSLVTEGSAKAAWQAMKDDMNNDLTTNVTKDLVNNFFDDVEKHAKERVANAKPPAGSYVSTQGSTPEAIGPTDKEMRAMEQLFKQLQSVVEESNPVNQALQKIAAAQDIVTKAMASGSPKVQALLAQYGGGAAIMDALRAKLEDQIHPYDAMVKKLLDQAAALNLSTDAQKRATQVDTLQNEAKQKGVTLTTAQVNELVRLTNMIESEKELNKNATEAYQKLFGAQKTYGDEQAGVNKLLADGRINAEQYADAIDKARLAYLEGSAAGKTFEGGMERAWLQIKADVTDVGSVIKTTFTDAFASVENALVDLVTKGAVDWHAMVQSMLADLTKLLERQALMALFSGGGSGGGVTNNAVGALETDGLINPFLTAAGGNQWTVGGSGAQDSQVVAFRASPGERVTVDHGPNTGGRLGNDGQSSGGGGGGGTVIHVINDPRAIVAAMSHPAAKQVMLTTFGRGQKYIKNR